MSSNESETRNRILEATRQLMEKEHGKGVRMKDIAQRAGVSRQAIYLHFANRVDLLVATTRYLDVVLGLDERIAAWEAASSGEEQLDLFVTFWGNYLPEIYGMAKGLIMMEDSDADAAAAWADRKAAIRRGCQRTVATLAREGSLASNWTEEEAIDLFYTALSVKNWEHLTLVAGWSTERYIEAISTMIRRTLIVNGV